MSAFFRQFFHCLFRIHQMQTLTIKGLGKFRSCYTCKKDFR